MKRSKGEKIFSVVNTIILIIIGIICIVPMLHVIMASVSDPVAVAQSHNLILKPLKSIQFEAYRMILEYEGLWKGYRNTIFYVVAQCIITTTLSAIGGYCLSRKTFRYRKTVMLFILFSMIFNGGMIPTYMVVRKLGILDTVWAMLLPGAVSSFNIIVMRTAFMSIPDSLVESAVLDGAGELTVLFKIMLPLVKSSIAVIVLFTAVAKWNDYYTALIYLPTNQDLLPLQMYIRNILNSTSSITSGSSSSEVVQAAATYSKLIEYAVITVSTLPILCIYPFVQKYFIKGVMIGSVKG